MNIDRSLFDPSVSRYPPSVEVTRPHIILPNETAAASLRDEKVIAKAQDAALEILKGIVEGHSTIHESNILRLQYNVSILKNNHRQHELGKKITDAGYVEELIKKLDSQINNYKDKVDFFRCAAEMSTASQLEFDFHNRLIAALADLISGITTICE